MGESEWRECELGDLMTLQRGFDLPYHARKPGRVPIVSSSGPSGFHSEAKCKAPGIVTGRYGTLGEVHFIHEDYWPLNTALYVKDMKGNDPRFLYYLLGCTNLAHHNDKSGVPGVNRNDLHKIEVMRPPLPEQRAIARVLGVLDDKIELNRRMNRTLEDLARGLFRSWFVDFDPVLRRAGAAGPRPGTSPITPGIAPWPARLVDSPLGPIPEGWRVSKVGEHMVNFDSKRVPVAGGERAKRQGKYPYYGAASVMDYVDNFLFDGIYLLVGEDGSVIQPSGLAVTQYVWGKIWVNNHAHVLQGKGAVCTEHLWAYFQHEDVGGIVTGAVQPKITQGNMNNLPFLYPGEDVCREFARLVAPWFARIRANTDETRELAALRDALLPQLLSGEIRLRDAELAASASLEPAGTPRRGDGVTLPRTGTAAGTTKGKA